MFANVLTKWIRLTGFTHSWCREISRQLQVVARRRHHSDCFTQITGLVREGIIGRNVGTREIRASQFGIHFSQVPCRCRISSSSRGATVMNEQREDWSKRWETGEVGFHLGDAHPYLLKFADRMTGGEKYKRILVPFAGKSFDIIWLMEQGHSVVAVEYVEKPVVDFFAENKLEARKTKVFADGKSLVCYKTSDNRLHFYVASLFDITPSICGLVDCVFDRGALVAVFPPEREKYVSTVLSLLSSTGRYLVITVDFKAEEYERGPRSVPDEVLKALFEYSMDIEQLACKDARSQAVARGYGEKTYFFEKAHLMMRSST